MQSPPHTQPLVSKAALKRRIESLDAPADIKLLLDNLLEATILVSGKIVQIGSKILEAIFDFAKAYPGTALGILAALIMAYLVSSIPVLGPVLSPVLTPLLLILGIGLGTLSDLTDSSMKLKMTELAANFLISGSR